MSDLQISIRGYVVGPIWWPSGAECFKPLSYNLTRENARFTEPGSLRDHVLAATNDGDFQSCTIACGELVVKRTSYTTDAQQRITRKRCVTRIFPLSRFPSIADCLHPDGDDWCPPADYDE